MVASIPYIKSQEPHLLEQYTPEITSVYITSRLEIVEATVKRQIEDPFDDLANLFQQLEQVNGNRPDSYYPFLMQVENT